MMPSTREIMEDVLSENPNADINEIHSLIWKKIQKYKRVYFRSRIDEFLSTVDIEKSAKRAIRKGLLQPITVRGVKYDNFLVAASRRMSQSIQPRSGASAELCAEIALKRESLVRNVHYTVRDDRADLTLHYPNIENIERIHRVEVKNMKLRERAVRGLAFDGDSLFGFFDSPGEFTPGNIEVFEKELSKTGGYLYLPSDTIDIIETEMLDEPCNILRPNTRFGADMAAFVKTGKIPRN